METFKPESFENKTEEQKELDLILEKINSIGLPNDIVGEIGIGLEQFVKKNKEDSMKGLKEILIECDMLINYKTQIYQSYGETGSGVDIKEKMKLAGESLTKIRNIIHEYSGPVQ